MNVFFSYTNGSTYGNVYAADSNLQFHEGYGMDYPFNGTFDPRIWNGNIHYATGRAGSPMTLVTSYTTDTTTQGQMFDVTANNDVDVTGFQLNLDAGSHEVEVYFRMGTHEGYEADGLAWTPLVADTVTSTGGGAGTVLALPSAVQIPSGRTYGFYVTTTGNTQLNAITPPAGGARDAVGAVARDDFNIEILVGTGVAYSHGATSAPQIFSGAVDYNACSPQPN